MTDETRIITEFANAIPTPVYYIAAGTVGAIFGLVGWVYKTMMKKQDDEIERVETQAHKRITQETNRLDRRISRELNQVNSKLDQISNQLLVIASNTSRRSDDMTPFSTNTETPGYRREDDEQDEDDDND